MGKSYQSVFSVSYDVAVLGLGYAGFSAALSAACAGKRVLLLDDKGR